MSESKCPICGKPTNVYMGNARKDGLCKEHGKMANAGEIVKCPDCGKWNKKEVVCNCKETKKASNELTCIICGEKSNGKPQCKDCWEETQDFISEENKNDDMFEFRDHYYNLKDAIFRMKNFESVKKYCNKLIAIAQVNEKYNNDTSLIDKVFIDVKKLIEQKKPKEEKKITEKDTQKDEQRANIHTADDGHKVKSEPEQTIDNALWSLNILHAYEPNVMEIIEKRKKADWFIPITGTGPYQGIYIEYWGMTTQKYKNDRKEREELYKKNDIPYIGIEKDEPKDTHSLKDFIIKELSRQAEKKFGFMPYWGKKINIEKSKDNKKRKNDNFFKF